MAFPLIPFATGLAVGALAGFGSREAAVQRQVKQGSQFAVSSAEGLYAYVPGGLAGLFGVGTALEKPVAAETDTAKPGVFEETAAPPSKRKGARKAKAGAGTPKRATTRSRKSKVKTTAAD